MDVVQSWLIKLCLSLKFSKWLTVKYSKTWKGEIFKCVITNKDLSAPLGVTAWPLKGNSKLEKWYSLVVSSNCECMSIWREFKVFIAIIVPNYVYIVSYCFAVKRCQFIISICVYTCVHTTGVNRFTGVNSWEKVD